MTDARPYLCRQVVDGMYEVRAPITPGEAPREYIVDLDKRTCTCRVFQAQGYPCIHATKVTLYRREPIQNYVNNAFKVSLYLKTYEGRIYPRVTAEDVNDIPTFKDIGSHNDNDDDGDNNEVSDLSDNDDNVLKPPNTRRPAGRPKKKQIRRDNGTDTRPFKCGRCEGFGHNKRTCTEALQRGRSA